MDKQYSHADHEQKIYDLWQENNTFSPTTDPKAESYTILMPPPNANDPLHIGHAMFVALEDIITRYQRMQGKSVLWLPGTDHAGIETQFVFEKKLAKDKKSRFDFDRETLYQMIWDYTQENSHTAVDQIKQLGASADWSRFKFMLDPDIVATVLDTFQKMYNDGLIYRSFRLVNYCTFCGTAFSALETDHQEKTSPFYQIKYGPFVIGTVRPETKFRDTALAVHPKDPRYQQHIGKTFEIMGLLGPIKMKVIADDEVDPEFGTGIMKVTPAHDPHDFELGQKHNLPVTPIIDIRGRMDFSWYLNDPQNTNPKYLERAKKYHGLKVNQMRELMKVDLEADGLLVDYNPQYRHTIGCCYRCQRPLEPLPLPQFYVKVKPLVKPILEALNKKQITIYGSGHDKILKHWLENLNDWNISRQIVWGIRIPVWYKIEKNSNIQVSFIDKDNNLVRGLLKDLLKDNSLNDIRNGLQTLSAPVDAQFVVSTSNPGGEYLQETDTFDTWFSSAQWPFSTLMNSESGDFERFYPTQIMETGYDILPFWVMRMLMVGKYVTNKLPFEKVYLHGLIRDPKGQKMSKSKGNVINPLTVVEKYGADALRLALVIRSSAGLDKNVGEAEFRAMRNFTNKIWNAARFVSLSYVNNIVEAGPEDANFTTTINQHTKDITRMLDQYKLGLAAETVYNNFWHWYCDEQIELNKQGRLSTKLLFEGLLTYLKLIHPFMPFVSEAVYQELRQQFPHKLDKETLLITSRWPQESG